MSMTYATFYRNLNKSRIIEINVKAERYIK